MSQIITGNAKLAVSVAEILSDGLGTGTISDALSYNAAFNNGTGANNINLHFPIDATLAASTPVTHILSALTDALGRAVAFTKVRILVILNLETTTGHDLTVGGAALHPWLDPFATVTDAKVTIRAGGALVLIAPGTNGYAVTSGTSDQLKLDPGTNSVHYQMLLAGE